MEKTRFLVSKLLQDGLKQTTTNVMPPKGIHGHKVTSRCLSCEFLSGTMGKYEKCFSSLSHPLHDLKLSSCLPDFFERNPTQITTLPNGLRIASEDAPGPAASIGFYVDCGSVYEIGEYIGVSLLLEMMAFKSTKHRTSIQIASDIQATRGRASDYASQEQMAYVCNILTDYLPEAIEVLADCMRNPIFLEHEVEEQVANVKKEIGEFAGRNPQQFLLELLHVTSYTGALGNPLVASETTLQRIDGSVIEKFYYENYTADRIVLAAFGVDHEHLLAITEPLLYDLQQGLPVYVPKSTYNSGKARFKIHSERTHVALVFEFPGGWRNEKNVTAMSVLQDSDFVAKAVDVAVAELLAMSTPGEVDSVPSYETVKQRFLAPN